MEPRGFKRAGPSTTTDSSKRRAPYAIRACAACRRRKGRCDGQQPCGYCGNRSQLCTYEEDNGNFRYPGRQTTSQEKDIGRAQDQAHSESQPTAQSPGPSLAGQVTSLRVLLNNVKPMAKDINEPNSSTDYVYTNALPSVEKRRSDGESTGVPNRQYQAGRDGPESNRTNQAFYGPTSPDYSMNLVQMKLRERSTLTPLHRRPMLPSFDEESITSSTSHWQPTRHIDRHQLLQFRAWLTLQDAKDALSTYHEVVGALHPFVDSEHMKKQLDVWYSYDSSHFAGGHNQPDDDDLIILVLMLAIAAQAQVDTIQAKLAVVMHSSVQHAANATTTSGTASMKQAIIGLLLGYYYFCYDLPRLALRMCGTAGRILLELGFHNGDVLDQVLHSEDQRKAACVMMSSIIILDRQWSGMTGLPANFPNATFNPTPTYLIDAPYTIAMYKLILISDRFNEPIMLAARGNGHIDDDAIELLVFQIQQWEQNSVGDEILRDTESWVSNQAAVPPPWALLVVFRAASVRSLLLRPYFFPTSHIQRSKKHILPALALASHVMDALATLDLTTTIYRNQRPYYQYILASICALMFLVTGYVEEHRQALSQYLPPDYDDQILHCFQLAKGLTEKYAGVSKAARTLWRRIRELCYAMESYGSQSSADTGRGLATAPANTGFTTVNTPLTPQQSQSPACPQAQKEPQTVMQDSSFQFDPWSFGGSLDIDFTTDGDNGVLQNPQAWGLAGWPYNM
ncbi:hypothetical protein F5883DRAFT_569778 [Diaporthe sp. PMI_573]|nr:hypothetical protein F5883DRAFT_597147 [Diaporthaceae sp. PMI_573]KAH8755989.1 hypothetical protein F5883DRAFT_569778 [Diaporthaceae sp. PMI_573]